jgi:hypothetical protein
MERAGCFTPRQSTMDRPLGPSLAHSKNGVSIFSQGYFLHSTLAIANRAQKTRAEVSDQSRADSQDVRIKKLTGWRLVWDCPQHDHPGGCLLRAIASVFVGSVVLVVSDPRPATSFSVIP